MWANMDSILNVALLMAIVTVLAWKALEGSPYLSSLQERLGKAWRERRLGGTERKEATEAEDESDHELGEELDLPVEDLHFGLPRCRITVPGLDRMAIILKSPLEELQEQRLDVARVRLGHDSVWVAQGMRSCRLAYVMKKRGDVPKAHCVVGEPPPAREDEDEDDHPDVWGTDYGKIMLIP